MLSQISEAGLGMAATVRTKALWPEMADEVASHILYWAE